MTHDFTLILHPPTPDFDAWDDPDGAFTAMADRLYEAGCDDASFGSVAGVLRLDFHRAAVTLGLAVGSAIANVESAGYRVARVEIGDADHQEEHR